MVIKDRRIMHDALPLHATRNSRARRRTLIRLSRARRDCEYHRIKRARSLSRQRWRRRVCMYTCDVVHLPTQPRFSCNLHVLPIHRLRRTARRDALTSHLRHGAVAAVVHLSILAAGVDRDMSPCIVHDIVRCLITQSTRQPAAAFSLGVFTAGTTQRVCPT